MEKRKSKKTINLNKIVKMEKLSFKNALRLHYDSISLFKNKSYPSAYFLSTLALEELGKAYMFEDFIFHYREDTIKNENLDKKFLGLIYSHTYKQRFFAGEYIWYLPKEFVKKICNGKLETLKQNSVYVGLPKIKGKINLKGKINSPFGITKKKAQKQIALMHYYFLDMILGTVKEVYTLEIEDSKDIFTKTTVSKLKKIWKIKSHKAKLRISKLESIN